MKRVTISIIKMYRKLNDVLVMAGFPPSSCRFHPTCSSYMEQAVEKYGFFVGVGMGIKRIFRCHPFFAGGYDPVK